MNTGPDGRSHGRAGAGWTRREYLAALGAGGAVGSLAGCTETNDIVDSPEVFGYQFPYDAETTHVGPWSTSDPDSFYPLIYEARSYAAPASDRQLGDVVESVDVDGATATVTFADGFTWWSGEPVTARDTWVHDEIHSHVSSESAPSVELVDEYTLRYEFERPLDRPLVLSEVASGAVRTPVEFYEPWLDRLREATTDDRTEEVVADLRTESPGLETLLDEGLGCGPYELTEVSINRLVLERFDDHPRAEEISIPRLWLPVVQEVSIENLIKKGWLDGGTGTLHDERGSPAENLEQIARYRTTSGSKLVLDWRNDHLARRGVRRAILAAIPVDDVVEVASWGEPTARQTGLAGPAERRWLPESVRESFHEYPVEADTERAAEHMRAAGYTRDENDTWRDEDDRRARFNIGTPVWDDFVSAGSMIESSLGRFGFDVSIDRVPNTRIHYEVTQHTYDVMLWSFDGRPHRAYDVTSDGATSIGYGVSDASTASSSQGKPVEVRVPRTPGDVDAPESDRRTVNLVDVWRTIRRPTDRSSTVDAVSTFATWWNDALPDVYLGTEVTGLWGNTRDFEWPSEETGSAYGTAGPGGNPVFHMLKHGAIRPAGDE
ncbi:ABC transporter substrate-binding protein [Halosimplex amylolyticum]|uniref:ABC transporter substrate-binding protein n=1 Tax=Halosimplex amylolyticum TaxID=3396616 RepID=UPI003F5765EE